MIYYSIIHIIEFIYRILLNTSLFVQNTIFEKIIEFVYIKEDLLLKLLYKILFNHRNQYEFSLNKYERNI